MGLFGKKNDTGEGDDANRSALFGSRSKGKNQTPSTNPYAQATPPSSNPYAQAPASSNNPYAQAPADPYTSAKQKAYGGPDPYASGMSQGSGGYAANNGYGGDNKSAAFTGTAAGGGYGDNRFANQSGYGSDRYGTAGPSQGQAGGSRYGPGGYGGLGGSFSGQDDENRSALFGGAQERMQQKQQQGGYGGEPPPYENGGQGGYGGPPGGYGGNDGGYTPGPKYQDRQLTAEEEEEEEVKATKNQIRFIKQGDVASTRNALRVAQQAEEVGRDTLARLGVQGEHIFNAERNLNHAHSMNKDAEEKARELKTLNRSMFAVHVANPFTAKSREAAKDQAALDKHLAEKDAREATRKAAYLSDQRMHKNFKDLSATGGEEKRAKNLAERAKYQFEADSEDEEMENEIDSNLDQLAGVTSRLNMLARATGEEVDAQNRHIERIEAANDRVDVGITANRARLDRIR